MAVHIVARQRMAHWECGGWLLGERTSIERCPLKVRSIVILETRNVSTLGEIISVRKTKLTQKRAKTDKARRAH